MSGKPRVLLYNRYFSTAGGGERSTLDLAQALDELGYEINLAVDEPVDMTLEDIVKPFGVVPKSDWRFLEFSNSDEMIDHVKRERIECFANHTYGSFLANPSPVGFYLAMFPQEASAENTHRLHSYNAVLCNSHFTEYYVKRRWGEELPTVVMTPPILRSHLAQEGVCFKEKEKLILSVGRFNVFGHNKNQLEAIGAFTRLVHKGILDASWKFVLAGHVNPSQETERYLEKCKRAASGLNVDIMTNVPIDTLCAFYRRASYLWQFTGIDMDFGVNPEQCEHLGLVALDSFAYGVIPIVYQRSGMTSLIDHGKNGYVFGDVDELARIMENASSGFNGSYHKEQFNWSLDSAQRFSFEAFRERIGKLLGSVNTDEVSCSA